MSITLPHTACIFDVTNCFASGQTQKQPNLDICQLVGLVTEWEGQIGVFHVGYLMSALRCLTIDGGQSQGCVIIRTEPNAVALVASLFAG